MADAQKIEPCDVCGGAGMQSTFELPRTREQRFRVHCVLCGHMTPHFGHASLALAVWNERTGQREDKLAG